MIVADAYDVNSLSTWVSPIYHQVVNLGNARFLADYVELMMTNSSLFIELVSVNTFSNLLIYFNVSFLYDFSIPLKTAL